MADIEVDMVADMEVYMVATISKIFDPKFFQAEALMSPNFYNPKLTPACASSKFTSLFGNYRLSYFSEHHRNTIHCQKRSFCF